jgi:hypothetical protein
MDRVKLPMQPPRKRPKTLVNPISGQRCTIKEIAIAAYLAQVEGLSPQAWYHYIDHARMMIKMVGAAPAMTQYVHWVLPEE